MGPDLKTIFKRLNTVKSHFKALSKMRYLVTLDVLINLYYTLIYPFLIYGLVVWGNTYPTNIKLLFILKKRTTRMVTFSKFDKHSSQLFKLANILNFFDLVTFHVSIFMFKFHNKLLPAVLGNYFLLTSKVHNYNTRLSSNHAYSLPTARTNYGIFNIRFTGAKVLNSIEAEFKNVPFKAFKARLKSSFVSKY